MGAHRPLTEAHVVAGRAFASQTEEEHIVAGIIRNQKDFGAGILYIAFGAVGWYIARDYGIGQASRMGPGYFPTVLAYC